MTDEQVIKNLEHAMYSAQGEDGFKELYWEQLSQWLDLIKRLKAENTDLFYKLSGVMLSVDKWLEGDELKQDEVNRAATMREKTLRIVEEQQTKIERLVTPTFIMQTEELTPEEFERFCKQSKKVVVFPSENTSRFEAYKEFAERLAEDAWFDSNYGEWLLSKDYLDNLLAELTGETFTKVEHNSLCETETYKGEC